MNQRPGALWHMLKWGLLSAIPIEFLYFSFSVGFGTIQEGEWFRVFLIVCFFAGVLGTWLGIILGIIGGILLKILTAGISRQFIQEGIQSRRKFIYPIIFIVQLLTAIIFSGVNLARLISLEFSQSELVYIVTLTVMSGVLTYAARRYLRRLEQWGKFLDSRKSKAKHKNEDFARLVDEEEITDYTILDSHISTQEAKS